MTEAIKDDERRVETSEKEKREALQVGCCQMERKYGEIIRVGEY